MLPIFFITALLISAGLLCFGYIQEEKAAIFIGGVILILLGVSAAANNVDYASGTNTTILTENQYQPHEYTETTNSTNSTTTKTTYLLMNSSTTQTDTTTYSETAGIINNILGVILALVGLYFVIAAFIII